MMEAHTLMANLNDQVTIGTPEYLADPDSSSARLPFHPGLSIDSQVGVSAEVSNQRRP